MVGVPIKIAGRATFNVFTYLIKVASRDRAW